MADYIYMANYTDYALGELLSYLKSRPDYKNMMIVITGDHERLAAIALWASSASEKALAVIIRWASSASEIVLAVIALSIASLGEAEFFITPV